MSVSQLAQDPKPPQAKATGKGLGISPNPVLWDEDFLWCFLLLTEYNFNYYTAIKCQ